MKLRKILLILFVLILAAAAANAANYCNDTDAGPVDPEKPTKFIGIKGSVDYGTGPKYDYCVSRLGGSRVSESGWVREYYCDGISIASDDYRCEDYHYASCKEGVCINYTGTQAELDDVGVPPSESNENCGNDKLDGKEECDPPGKICMAYGGGVGTCSDECKCVKASDLKKNQTNTTNTTNQTNITNNTHANQSNTTNQTSKPVFSAGTTTTTASFEIQENDSTEEPEKEKKKAKTPTGALPTDIQEIIQENNEDIEDFSKKPGIRFTSAITGFVKGLWSWVIGIFGG